MLPPSSLTVPDVQVSRVRFFMEELCSRRCSDGRSGRPAEGDALGAQRTGFWGTTPTVPSRQPFLPDRRDLTGVPAYSSKVARYAVVGIVAPHHRGQMGVLVGDGLMPVHPTPSRNRRQSSGVTVLCRYLSHHILTCPRPTPYPTLTLSRLFRQLRACKQLILANLFQGGEFLFAGVMLNNCDRVLVSSSQSTGGRRPCLLLYWGGRGRSPLVTLTSHGATDNVRANGEKRSVLN